MQRKGANLISEGFSLRVKIGDYEVELSGTRREVMDTIDNLSDLVVKINNAFEHAKPKSVATITVKAGEEEKNKKGNEPSVQNYPKIEATAKIDQAVVKLLESEWGKWRPRTMLELRQAMRASNLTFPEHDLSSILDKLSKKGLVRRWDTAAGSVFILVEQKSQNKRSKIT